LAVIFIVIGSVFSFCKMVEADTGRQKCQEICVSKNATQNSSYHALTGNCLCYKNSQTFLHEDIL